MVLPRATMLPLPTPLGPTRPSLCPAMHPGTTLQVHNILRFFDHPACTPSLTTAPDSRVLSTSKKHTWCLLCLWLDELSLRTHHCCEDIQDSLKQAILQSSADLFYASLSADCGIDIRLHDCRAAQPRQQAQQRRLLQHPVGALCLRLGHRHRLDLWPACAAVQHTEAEELLLQVSRLSPLSCLPSLHSF